MVDYVRVSGDLEQHTLTFHEKFNTVGMAGPSGHSYSDVAKAVDDLSTDIKAYLTKACAVSDNDVDYGASTGGLSHVGGLCEIFVEADKPSTERCKEIVGGVDEILRRQLPKGIPFNIYFGVS